MQVASVRCILAVTYYAARPTAGGDEGSERSEYASLDQVTIVGGFVLAHRVRACVVEGDGGGVTTGACVLVTRDGG